MAAVPPALGLPVAQPVRPVISRTAVWLVAALWTCVLLLLLWFLQGWGSPRAQEWVVTWSPLPSELMALGLLVPLLLNMPAGFRRKGWILLSLAAFSDVLATGWWALTYAPPTPANSLWSDLPYFLYYPLAAAAYLMFFRELGGRLHGRAMLLDASALALGFGATLWLYLIQPQIQRTGLSDPALINLVAFCIGNDVLMVMMSLMIMQVLYWRSEAGLLLAAGAAVCAYTTDLKWLEAGQGYYIVDTWSNIGGYSLYFALLGTGAYLERYWRIPAMVRVLGGNRYSVLPILSVLTAVGMLYGEHVELSGIEWIVPVGFALTGVLLVVARQQGVRNEIRRLSEALARRDAQAHLTELIRHSADMVAVVDADLRPTFVSPASEKVLGVPAASLSSRPATELLGTEHEERLRRFLAEVAAVPRQRPEMELIVQGADGVRRALQVLGSNQLDNPAIAGIALTVRDVTERRRLEREVLEIGLLERERLAGEIRESLGSELERVKRLVAELRAVADCGADARGRVTAAVAQVNRSIDVARRLSIRLSPLHVARGALDVAIGSLCADFALRFSTEIDLRCGHGTGSLNAGEADHLYRIVQEILDYLVRAGATKRVEVDLRCEGQRLHLSVHDLDSRLAADESRNLHGLHLAAYRAHVLGGGLRRRVGEDGLRVDVTIPLRV